MLCLIYLIIHIFSGNLCDLCLDGYYGDPTGRTTGRASGCKKCTCNGNIDPNAVGNCNRSVYVIVKSKNFLTIGQSILL